MTVLVTGSSGKVGSQLVQLLHEKGVAVRAGSSNPDRLTPNAGIETVELALDNPTHFAPALDGIDAVFLYCEPAAIDAFVKQAEAAGVQHAVIMSADAVLRPGADSDPIAAGHLAVERALAASALTSTALNCGALASNALPWAWSLKGRGAVALPYPDSHADPVNERDVAEAAYAVLTEPRLRGLSYHLTGPSSLTFTEQIGIIAAAVGRDIPVEQVTPETWWAGKPGFMPDDIADALLKLWAASTNPVPLSDDVETLTGHPARPFSEWAAQHAAAFRT
ncbi:NAD(P)H-binding protein [Streptomyces luteolus]|uniref:NAD(P)H-binding protein n=1 Tax=Streptomyces luteolus TaxID=3043615 RepID=A0ABT6T6C0_9ACTN|nr:NAD(P)H-binding protein [Streptomyces sp. B-S-A12]MDI3422589.1 NAD(P)H-binding protein [Streptomyces sp. B-S-A12]